MKNYFFAYIDNIPRELHSNIFSNQHILTISIVIIFGIILTIIFKDMSLKIKWKLMALVSLMLPLLEISQMVWYKSVGHFSFAYALPLHLCSLMSVILPIMIFTRNKLLMEYSYAMGLAPSFLTLLTPDVYYYPNFSYIYLQSMLIHGIICFIPLFLIFGMGFRPNIRNLPKAIVMLFGFALMILPINYITDGNYFFLRYPAPGSIMEFFANIVGSPGYLFPTFLLGCILWLLMYLPFVVIELKEKHSQQIYFKQQPYQNRDIKTRDVNIGS